jgi:hypothetical protein
VVKWLKDHLNTTEADLANGGYPIANIANQPARKFLRAVPSIDCRFKLRDYVFGFGVGSSSFDGSPSGAG